MGSAGSEVPNYGEGQLLDDPSASASRWTGPNDSLASSRYGTTSLSPRGVMPKGVNPGEQTIWRVGMERTCQDCAAWKPDVQKSVERREFGECRRLPPQQPRGAGSSFRVRGWWPWTKADDWCLSWKATEGDEATGG